MVTYEPGFKEQAIKMAAEIEPVKTAQDLGIPVYTLYTWMRHTKTYGERTHMGSGNKRQGMVGDESARQAKRIKELEKATQILKDALSFFVVSQKK